MTFKLHQVVASGVALAVVSLATLAYQPTATLSGNNVPANVVSLLHALIPSAHAETHITSTKELLNQVESTIADLERKIEDLKAISSPTTQEKNNLESLNKALNFYKQIKSTYQESIQLDEFNSTLPTLTEQARTAYERLNTEFAKYQQTGLKRDKASKETIQQEISELKNKIALNNTSLNSVPQVDNTLATQINDKQNRAATLENQSHTTNLSDAESTAVVAELEYLRVQIDYLKQLQTSQNNASTYYETLHNTFTKQSELYNLQLEELNAAYSAAVTREQEQLIHVSPLVAQQVGINQEYVSNLHALNQTYTELQQQLTRLNQQLNVAQTVSSTIDNQISLLQGTLELNRLINEQKNFLPDISYNISYAKQIVDWRVKSFQLIGAQQLLKDRNNVLEQIYAKRTGPFTGTDAQQEEKALNTVLDRRAQLLTDNINAYNNVIGIATEIDAIETQLINIVNNINAKLNQQDFFVRSTPSINLSWVNNLMYGISNQFNGIISKLTIRFGDLKTYVFAIALIVIGVITRRQQPRIIRTLAQLRERVNQRGQDNLTVTPLAIILSMFTDIDKPLKLGGLTLIIINTFFNDDEYIIDYFLYSFIFLMFFTFADNLLRRGGIMNTHYSPKGSFYAKHSNHDELVQEMEFDVPQPRVAHQPTKIFASSSVVHFINKNFLSERLAYVARVQQNGGFEPEDEEHTLYNPTSKKHKKTPQETDNHDPEIKAAEPIETTVNTTSFTPVLTSTTKVKHSSVLQEAKIKTTKYFVDDQLYQRTKEHESDKYFDLPNARVKTEFRRVAHNTADLRAMLAKTKWLIFTLVNVMYFNLHPGVTPSENIIGQLLYLTTLVGIFVIILAFVKGATAKRIKEHGSLNLKAKLLMGTLIVTPILLFILTFAGYVNTTTILLQHGLFTFYAFIILFLINRLIHREFAILSLNSARRNRGDRLLDLLNNPEADQSVDNIYERAHKAKLQEYNYQRDTYFEVYPGFDKLAGVLSATFAIVIFFYVWSDLMSIVNYLNNITVWSVTGATPDIVENITLLNLFRSLVTIVITYLVYRNLKPLLDILLFSKLKLSEGLPYAIQTVLTYIIIAFGFGSAFSALGMSWSKLQWLFSALLVGLGFGLQEIFANFVSGIILLFERPIRINDFITINSISGTVKNIRIRATTLIDADNKEVIIPNKTFVTGTFTNWSLSDTKTRLVYNIGVAYGSDIDQVQATLLEAANMSPRILHGEDAPSCFFMEFAASSLNFVLRVYVPTLADRTLTVHEINRSINELCNQRNINITFNQLDIYIKDGSGVNVRVDSSVASSGVHTSMPTPQASSSETPTVAGQLHSALQATAPAAITPVTNKQLKS